MLLRLSFSIHSLKFWDLFFSNSRGGIWLCLVSCLLFQRRCLFDGLVYSLHPHCLLGLLGLFFFRSLSMLHIFQFGQSRPSLLRRHVWSLDLLDHSLLSYLYFIFWRGWWFSLVVISLRLRGFLGLWAQHTRVDSKMIFFGRLNYHFDSSPVRSWIHLIAIVYLCYIAAHSQRRLDVSNCKYLGMFRFLMTDPSVLTRMCSYSNCGCVAISCCLRRKLLIHFILIADQIRRWIKLHW